MHFGCVFVRLLVCISSITIDYHSLPSPNPSESLLMDSFYTYIHTYIADVYTGICGYVYVFRISYGHGGSSEAGEHSTCPRAGSDDGRYLDSAGCARHLVYAVVHRAEPASYEHNGLGPAAIFQAPIIIIVVTAVITIIKSGVCNVGVVWARQGA
jgi:hypothetical protein